MGDDIVTCYDVSPETKHEHVTLILSQWLEHS